MSKNNVVAVLGSPSFSDEALLAQVLDQNIQPGQTVLTNEAGGASLLTRVWCRKFQVSFQVIRPERYKKDAQNEDEQEKIAWADNNTEIAEKCDVMIVFWDGGSPGAIDAAWKADLLGKRVLIIQVGQATPAELAELINRFQKAG